METTRLLYIDLAKTIGLILVILSHSVAPQLMKFSVLFFISIFFICSGYTQQPNYSIGRKAKKLVAPYFLFNALFLLLAVVTNKASFNQVIGIFYGTYSLYPSASDQHWLFLNIGNGPTWFLLSLFMSFLTLKWILRTPGEKNRSIVVLGFLLITLLFHYVVPILLPFQLTTCFFFSIVMYSGMLIRRYRLLENSKLFVPAIVIYIVCFYFNGPDVNLSVGNYGHSVILTLIGGVTGAFALLWVCKAWIGHKERFVLSMINKYALPIFCIQIPLLTIAEKISNRFLSNPTEFELYAVAIFQLAFTLCAGYWISKVLVLLFPSILGGSTKKYDFSV